MDALRGYTSDQLFGEIKRRVTCQTKPKKNIIMVGPPGSGKELKVQQSKMIFAFAI